MNQNPTSYNLIPAGYLILQESDEAMRANEYLRAFGPYFGVDRLPPFVAPDVAVRQALGMPPMNDVHLHATLDEWFDSPIENTAFIAERAQALRLCKAFEACGHHFEVVYCELAWKRGEEDRSNAYPNAEDGRSCISLTYGYDVSWPTCNHSAILQPGVVPSSPSWRERLNQHGLLSDYESAVELRNDYLAVYPCPPFDIYLVHRMIYH
jgi:hypothetical protein